MRKFSGASPTIMQDIAPVARPLSPAPSHLNHHPRPDAADIQDMEIDSATTVPVARAGINRTPLPSGPSMKRPSSSTSIAEPVQLELQNTVSRIVKSPFRCRYATASVLILCWCGDEHGEVYQVLQELGHVLQKDYQYPYRICTIPRSTDTNHWRYVMNTISDFMGQRDQRDSLKIVLYNGHSYLDANREMVLAR